MNKPTQTVKIGADALASVFGGLLQKAQADSELAALLRQLAAATLEALPEDTLPKNMLPDNMLPKNTLSDNVSPEAASALLTRGLNPGLNADLDTASEAGLRTGFGAGVDAYSDEYSEAYGEPPLEPASEDAASDDDVAQLLSSFPQRDDALGAQGAEDEPAALDPLPGYLRLKARACRWLSEYGFTGDERALRERYALIEEGKQTGCFLWVLAPSGVNPNASSALKALAENYEGVAAALETWLLLEGHALEHEVAQLLAEAQAALRAAVTEVRGDHKSTFPWFDEHQQTIFADLKRYGAQRRVYLPHLSLKNICDPAAYAERTARLEHVLRRLQDEEAQTREKQRAFNQLSYHVRQLGNHPQRPEHDWARVAEAVDSLLAAGLAETDVGLRERLKPVAGLFPDASPHGQVKRILEALAATEQERLGRSARQPPRRAEALPPAVAEVAQLLAGRTVVMIGGEPKQEVVAQLRAALECRVVWVDAPKHASPSSFKSAIVRDEVALVLLLIRWSSHVFGEVEAFCDEFYKHLVRVPGGYNVNSLAHAVLEQVGDKLRRSAQADYQDPIKTP